jgi:hypothetical protein
VNLVESNIPILKDGWFIRPDGVEAYAKVIGLEWIIKKPICKTSQVISGKIG